MKVKELQHIAGTLHHVSMGIAGSRGLFTPIWVSMKTENKGYINRTTEMKQAFSDLGWLFQEMINRPVNTSQLVPRDPNLHGYTDACKYAAGGLNNTSTRGNSEVYCLDILIPTRHYKMPQGQFYIN